MPVSVHTERELRQVLAELELVSHVPALDYAGKSANHGNASDERSPGGKRPLGGDAYDLSVEHFWRRLANVHSETTARLILGEMRDALEAHRRAPPPSDRPELSSPQWKRWVGESDLSASKIAQLYGCKRQYVDRIRARYRPA